MSTDTIVGVKEIGTSITYGRFPGTERPKQVMRLWRINLKKSFKEGSRRGVFWPERLPPPGIDAPPHKAEFRTGASYTGSWHNNKKHGYGVHGFPNGDKYEGQWDHGERSGEGIYWQKVGKGKMRKQYTGAWAGNKRNGAGTCFYKKGEYYQGMWRNDQRHGEGQMKYVDGDVYLGQWYEDQRSGWGQMLKSNGDAYEGSWLNDQREGHGAFFYNRVGKVWVGEWAADIPRAGIYTQAESNPAQVEEMPVTTTVPICRLAQPGDVLEDALAAVRLTRTAFRARHAPLKALFSEQELVDLEAAFREAPCTAEGRVQRLDVQAVYLSLGISFSETDLQELLAQVGAPDGMPVEFEHFSRTIALIIDDELADPRTAMEAMAADLSVTTGEELAGGEQLPAAA